MCVTTRGVRNVKQMPRPAGRFTNGEKGFNMRAVGVHNADSSINQEREPCAACRESRTTSARCRAVYHCRLPSSRDFPMEWIRAARRCAYCQRTSRAQRMSLSLSPNISPRHKSHGVTDLAVRHVSSIRLESLTYRLSPRRESCKSRANVLPFLPRMYKFAKIEKCKK